RVVFAAPRVRGRPVRRRPRFGAGARCGVGETLRGQRQHLDARSALFRILRLAPAGLGTNRATRAGTRVRRIAPNRSIMNPDLAALSALDCRPGAALLSADELRQRMKALAGWTHAGAHLTKTFKFGNYYETMAFVNAIAYVAHRQDHHPDLSVH